jgi:signal transduction histidine kinase
MADISEGSSVAMLEDDIAAIASIDAVPTILEVVCRSTGMGFAAVARVTDDRWVACSVQDNIAFGLQAGSELKLETTICHEIRSHRQPVVIDHVAQDERYSNHHTPLMYGFQSYLSMPIYRRSGEFFGTLCAIDPRPAKLNTPETLGMFKLFSELIGFHLDAQEKLTRSEAALIDERQGAELREQFIAVLGHDLRNPLASISAGASLLQRQALPAKAAPMVELIHKSVRRMSVLIDDVLDFARGRLGGGLSLDLRTAEPLGPELLHVVDELRAAWPERTIEADIVLPDPIRCDATRMAQLLSNLVANAITHGSADQPIRVEAGVSDGQFELCVINQGEPIPENVVSNLFQPFFRASARPSQQGLGLGLFIVSEIARAHGGVLDVSSTPARTCFRFRMPTTLPH